MAEETDRGVGKCHNDHPGSYGYPTRPEEPYDFCSKCGKQMVWKCPDCGDALPDDPTELAATRFCRQCGAALFDDEDVETASAADSAGK